jgi:choline dehydrogenase-like flavoprotein
MVTDTELINSDISLSADAVVVGSGAGGSTAAYLLSEAGLEVIVVEEGGYYKTKDFNGGISEMMGMLYRDAGLIPIFGKPNIPFAEGCCVGGSTVINGALCWRTPEHILNRWSSLYLLPLLDKAYMDEIFSKIEKDLCISVQRDSNANKTSQLLMDACDQLNWKYELVPRAQIDCQNVNRCPTGCPTGAKQSMLVTYLPKAVKNGARIYSNARVEKIEMKGTRAVGVEAFVKKGKKKHKLRINAERVFLACGSMQTPYLLRKNGFSKNIGSNLQIHINLKIVALFKDEIDPHIGTMMTAQVKEFQDENFYLGGSNFDPVYVAMTLSPHDIKIIERFTGKWRSTAIFLAQVKCSGSGRIIVNRFVNRPMPFYYLNQEDVRRISMALRKLIELMVAAGAVEIYLPIDGSPVIKSVSDIDDFLAKPVNVKRLNLLSVHVTSTCPMGANINKSAVDPFGLLYGTKNVYICDASILPEAPGVNPQVTIMSMVSRNINELLNNRGWLS